MGAGERFSVPGSADMGGDDFWSPEEHEAWARAIEGMIRVCAEDNARPLRRAVRKPKLGRLRRLDGDEDSDS
jgi:hypothetical protein